MIEDTKSSNIFDNKKMASLVESKLGKGAYKYDILYDFNGEERYVLVSGKNNYLIFDTILNDYVEFSRDDSSFYEELETNFEKIYLAPTYYFYKNEGSIYDLFDNRKLTISEINKYEAYEKQLKDSYNQSKPYVSDAKSGDDEQVYISDRYYFDNLRYNIGSNTPTNYPDSCTYVALGMLLAYNDSITNDNLIAETYDVNETKAFSSYGSIATEEYTASPGINDTFHAYLIQYGRNLGVTENNSNYISISHMDDLIEAYCEDRNLSVNTYTTGLFTNKTNFCKNAIDNNNPVLISISGTDTDISPNNLNHDVIGYGYDNTGIYAHFGWKYDYHTNTNINGYTINKAFYITITSSHSHSNNYLWTYNGCSGSICPCGNKSCNHGLYSYTYYSSSKHKKICNGCSNDYLESHHFQIIGSNQVCSECGYTQHNHSFSYTWTNYMMHSAVCACGESHSEMHVTTGVPISPGSPYSQCILCGGLALISINKPSFTKQNGYNILDY